MSFEKYNSFHWNFANKKIFSSGEKHIVNIFI